jgi:hypothetical protein
MDFSKAFDKVSHGLLVHKLDHYGIRGKTNAWMQNFLSDRSQAVVVDGEKYSYIDYLDEIPFTIFFSHIPNLLRFHYRSTA